MSIEFVERKIKDLINVLEKECLIFDEYPWLSDEAYECLVRHGILKKENGEIPYGILSDEYYDHECLNFAANVLKKLLEEIKSRKR